MVSIWRLYYVDQTICHTDEDKDGKDLKTDMEASGSGADLMNGTAAKQRKLDSASSSEDEDDDAAGGRKLSKASTKSGKSLSAKKKSLKPVTSKVYSKWAAYYMICCYCPQ